MKKILLLICLFSGALQLNALTPSPYVEAVSFNFKVWGSGTGSLTVYAENGTSFTSTNSSSESNWQTYQFQPGKVYTLMFQGSGPTDYAIGIIAPTGYVVKINYQQTDLLQRSPGGGTYTEYHSLEIVPMNNSVRDPAAAFSGVSLGKSVSWNVGLGGQRDGRSAGHIMFKEADLTNSPASRDRLYFSPWIWHFPLDVKYDGPSNQTLRQIYAPQVFVDLVDDVSGGYWMKFYDPAVATLSGSLYTVGSATPWKTIRVESPSTSQLKITQSEGSSSPVIYVSLVSAPAASGTHTWTVQDGGGSGPTYLRTTTLVSSLQTGYRRERVEVKDSSNVVASYTEYRYVNQGWGEEVTTVIADPLGAARTTTYEYYTSAGAGQLGNYRHVKSVTDPTGGWTKYDYYDDWNRRGQVEYEYHPYNDLPAAASSALTTSGRVVNYDYVSDYTGRYNIPSSTIEKVNNTQTTKSTASASVNNYQDGLKYTAVTTNSYFDASNSMTSWTQAFQSNAPDPNYLNKLTFQHNMDGTETSYVYHYGQYNPSTKVFSIPGDFSCFRDAVFHGTSVSTGADYYTAGLDGNTVYPLYLVPYKSTMEIAVHDAGGNIVRTEVNVYKGSGLFGTATYEDLTYDVAGRLLTRVASNGATTTNTYTKGQLTSAVDPAGTETTYTYDLLGRVVTMTKKGVTSAGGYFVAQSDIVTTYTYDAANRVTQNVVTGAGSLTRTEQATYDLGGFQLTSTLVRSAGNYVTTLSYSSGGLVTTTQQPDGATKVVERYLDGQMKSITGTGQPTQYWYPFIDTGNGRKVCRHSSTLYSSDWDDIYCDWLGRKTIQWVQIWGASQSCRIWGYDSNGRLQYDYGPILTNNTYYEYDSLGSLTRKYLDINSNGVFDIAGTDRGTDYSWTYLYSSGWWKVETTKTYTTNSSSTLKQVGSVETQLSNFSPALSGYTRLSRKDTYDVFGNKTTSYTEVKPADKMVVTTVDTPDSSTNTVQKVFNGQLIEATSSTGITMHYGYDGFGRKIQDIDPRTGTTTTTYAADTNQVTTVTDPASVTQATYTYDASGARVATVTNALSKVSRYSYDYMGNKIHEWGDVPNPVEYGYDAWGRMTTMKTYRGGTSWTGSTWPTSTTGTADTTTWTYDTPTGLLSSKTDAASKSVSYTYTQARQLYTRTDARSVVTTYSYDVMTGEQTGISYSDSTPSLTYTYNRLGNVATVADAAGTRTFTYNLSGTLELQNEILGTSSGNFYGDRRITRGYDNSTTGALGRYNGLYIGDSSNYSSQYGMSYGYDGVGRVNSAWNFNYSYISNSNLIDTVSAPSWSYTDVRTYNSTHDWVASRTTNVSSYYTTKSVFAYSYDTMGRVSQVAKTGELYGRYGNGTQGLTTYYGYDDRSQVTSETTKIGTTSTVLTGRDDGYAYDPVGNRSTATHNGNTATYTANALNQYSSRTVPGVFDVAGAASTGATVTVNGSSSGVTRHGEYFFKGQSLSNNPNAVYSSLSVSDGTTTTSLPAFLAGTPESMSYDDAGNMTSDGRWDYTYDAENRVVTIQTHASLCPGTIANADARRLEFKYDYLGRRVGKVVRGGYNGSSYATLLNDNRIVYDGWNVLLELDGNNYFAGIRIYVWGLDVSGTLQGAGGVGGLLWSYNFQNGAQLLPCYDAMGNYHAGVDVSNATLGVVYEYDAFGNTLRLSGVSGASNPFRFSTKYIDDETALVYYGQRFYSPSQGRFIGRDPSEEKGGIHLYAFCRNNGVNAYDYIGLDMYVTFEADEYGNTYIREAGPSADELRDSVVRSANNQNWMSYAEGAAASALDAVDRRALNTMAEAVRANQVKFVDNGKAVGTGDNASDVTNAINWISSTLASDSGPNAISAMAQEAAAYDAQQNMDMLARVAALKSPGLALLPANAGPKTDFIDDPRRTTSSTDTLSSRRYEAIPEGPLNMSGEGVLVDASGGFYAGVGGGGGISTLKLDNGTRATYVFDQAGVGVGGKAFSSQTGPVWGVFHPSDFAGPFYSFSLNFWVGGTLSYYPNGSASLTFGVAPGAGASMTRQEYKLVNVQVPSVNNSSAPGKKP